MARVVLITRDQDLGLETKQRISEIGLESALLPFYEVEALDFELEDLSPDAELIITSRNALKAKPIEYWRELNNKHVFLIIGANFSSYLASIGASNHRVFQNSSELVDYLDVNSKNYLYLRGEVISFDFKEHIPNIKEQICYKINYLSFDRQELQKFLNEKGVTDLLFLSLENAKYFLSLINEEELSKYKVFCLSQRIAKVFADFQAQIFYPEEPNFKALLTCLESH